MTVSLLFPLDSIFHLEQLQLLVLRFLLDSSKLDERVVGFAKQMEGRERLKGRKNSQSLGRNADGEMDE